MQNVTRIINLICAIAALLLAIAIVITLLTGCGYSQDNPIVEDPIAELYGETDAPNTVQTSQVTEPVYDEMYFARIMADRPAMPEILVKGIKIDPNEADKPLHKVVVNVDSDDLFAKTPNELDNQLGQPVDIIHAKERQDPRSHTRYYTIFDNGAASVSFYDEIVMDMTLYYRRGYPNSLDAVKAAGFQENEIKLVKHIPLEQIQGALRPAQDVYRAETDNRVYHQIHVMQTTKSKVWYYITIKPTIKMLFDDNDNIVHVEWGDGPIRYDDADEED